MEKYNYLVRVYRGSDYIQTIVSTIFDAMEVVLDMEQAGTKTDGRYEIKRILKRGSKL